MAAAKQLSKKSALVLSLIAEGHSYAQIVDSHSGISYRDIFNAAEEALKMYETPTSYQARLAKLKERYPKAYERWTEEDESDLAKAYNSGIKIANLTKMFQRQPSAIRSRLSKLGLLPDDNPAEDE